MFMSPPPQIDRNDDSSSLGHGTAYSEGSRDRSGNGSLHLDDLSGEMVLPPVLGRGRSSGGSSMASGLRRHPSHLSSSSSLGVSERRSYRLTMGREDPRAVAAREERKSLAGNKTRRVRALHTATASVLLLVAVAVTLGVFLGLRGEQKSAFQGAASFAAEGVAAACRKAFAGDLPNALEALAAVASVGSTTTNNNATTTTTTFSTAGWTARIGSAARVLSGSGLVWCQYSPLVAFDERAAWEEFAVSRQTDWRAAYEREAALAAIQDDRYGYGGGTPNDDEEDGERRLQRNDNVFDGTLDDNAPNENNNNDDAAVPGPTVYTGTAFRDRIWEPFDGVLWNDEESEAVVAGRPRPENTAPYYLPVWEATPSIPQMEWWRNLDALEIPELATALAASVSQQGACLGGTTSLQEVPPPQRVIWESFWNASLFRHALSPEEREGEPLVVLAYPVLGGLPAPSVLDQSEQPAPSGVISAAFSLRFLLQQSLLPSLSSGTEAKQQQELAVVFGNSLGQAHTYTVRLAGDDGADEDYEALSERVRYLGPGDLHDPLFDELGVEEALSDPSSWAGPETSSYTALDWDREEGVTYTVAVYPTETMESSYETDKPAVYAAVVACLFLVAALVFVVYSAVVDRRHEVVLDRAAKSTAVVKSLFPEAVQDRLYEDTEEDPPMAPHDRRSSITRPNGEPFVAPNGNDATPNREMIRYMTTKDFQMGTAASVRRKTPIADLFPHATIFFADLAGFTQWSSTRKPTDVFGLLEAVYGAFDAIAQKRRVFKVETIGDCYVAVTGVPEPQADHAVIMARFAAECSFELKELVYDLVPEHGPDTANLALRIGIHSGPVTAGVLRGERCRFQLFGDTVNTASRMESHGEPGRIHCSEQTARYLQAAGKHSWLKAREGTITAKGKGELQTYWIETTRSKSAAKAKSKEEEDNPYWSPSASGHRHPRGASSRFPIPGGIPEEEEGEGEDVSSQFLSPGGIPEEKKGEGQDTEPHSSESSEKETDV